MSSKKTVSAAAAAMNKAKIALKAAEKSGDKARIDAAVKQLRAAVACWMGSA